MTSMTSMSDIETIIKLQADLMAALDAGDVGRIEQTTKQLANAVEMTRSRQAVVAGGRLKTHIEHGLKQTEALKARVNFMTLRNREKMERLSEMRGLTASHVYANRRKAGITPLST